MSDQILFFTDPHLRDFGSFPPFNQVESNGFTRELNNTLAGFSFVAAKIRELAPAAVFLPGDVFHTPEGLSTTVIHAASQALGFIRDACKEVGARFYLMPGNHDCLNEKLGIYSVSTLGGYAELVMKDTILKVPYGDNKVLKVGIVQYSSDEGHVIERLKKLSTMCDLIVTHLDFRGCEYENGWRSESVIPATFPIPIISGDIHTAQIVGSVYYIGSLTQGRFTQTHTDGVGGVLTYDAVTNDIARYPNTESYHYVKIESPEQINTLNPDYKVVLQVKCELEDRSILDNYEHIYIPFKKRENVETTSFKLNFGSPFSMLKRFVADSRPEAVALLESIIQETPDA